MAMLLKVLVAYVVGESYRLYTIIPLVHGNTPSEKESQSGLSHLVLVPSLTGNAINNDRFERHEQS